MKPRNSEKEKRARERQLVVDRMKKKADQVRKVRETKEPLTTNRIQFMKSLEKELLRLKGFVMELEITPDLDEDTDLNEKILSILNSIDNLNFLIEEEIDEESKNNV